MSIFRFLAPVALVATLCACGGGGSSDTTVVNESQVIRGGGNISYPLNAGTYTVEVTAANAGVLIEWNGATNCTGAFYLTRVYKERCTMAVNGQLIIKNPSTNNTSAVVVNTAAGTIPVTTNAIGGDETITIKITR
ncbi:MAG: hypothetical protein RIR79_1076 [Pseudomonadota bacterium]|jgi:hypothetical protein